MDPFEFVLVIVSIVVGLALADLLSTVAKLLRADVKAGLLHSMWVFFVGVILLQQFWSRWVQVDRPDWSTLDVSAFVLPALLGYLAASLLSPGPEAATRSMDEYFVERRVPFLSVNILLLASYSLEDLVLGSGELWVHLLRAGIAGVFLLAILVRRRGVQLACVTTCTLIAIAFAYFWTSSLSRNAALAG